MSMTANQPPTAVHRLAQVLAETHGLAFAALIGSRANHTARESSDWDIAVLWKPADNLTQTRGQTRAGVAFAGFGRHELLRHQLAQCLNIADEKIDLIDLASASLAMKAAVAEEGMIVNLKDDLAWAHFQTATWRELEDYYWDRAHAA